MLDNNTIDLIRYLFDNMIPFTQQIGMQLGDISEDQVTITFDNQPHLVGNPIYQILHGGVISSVMDQAGGVMAMVSRLQGESITSSDDFRDLTRNLGTIDIRVDYLRPGKGENFYCNAMILRRGNKIAVTRMELYNQDDVLIATGTATYLVG